MRLRIEEVNFRPGVDPAGRLFMYDGGVYRAVSEPQASFYRQFLNHSWKNDLFKAGLVETWISDIEVDEYDLVLQHRRIEFDSGYREWCSLMIKDATLFICRLNLELAKRGFFTNDSSLGNVMFNYTNPIWVDFGSIVPIESVGLKEWFRTFWRHWIFPLWLLSKGKYAVAKAIYNEHPRQGVLRKWGSAGPLHFLPLRIYGIYRKTTRENTVIVLERLLDYLTGLDIEPAETYWSSKYRQGDTTPVTDPVGISVKNAAVHNLLKSLTPCTLLDMACNKGWYSKLAVSFNHRVIAFDRDDASVCRLYREARSSRLPLLPLVLDFAWPTAPYGMALRRPGAYDRLKCDTTLALGVVHYLVFMQKLSFDTIAEIISNYTKKVSIVEFAPRNHSYVAQLIRPEHTWYELDNFIRAFKKHFSKISLYDAKPPRKLLFCMK